MWNTQVWHGMTAAYKEECKRSRQGLNLSLQQEAMKNIFQAWHDIFTVTFGK